MTDKNDNETPTASGVDSSDLLATDELLALRVKVKEFCIKFDKVSWGWDGDCGTQCLVDDLAENVQDKYGDWTC